MILKKLHTPIIFIIGILLSSILVELYFILIERTSLWRILPAAEVSLYYPSESSGYALRPNVKGVWLTENRSKITISNQGLRDHDTTYKTPEKTYRIALSGDSITEALQVELDETFSVLIEKSLSTNEKKVEVINLGISGAVPVVQLKRIESLGLRFEPDLLVFILNVFDFLSPIMTNDSSFPGYQKNTQGIWSIEYGFLESRSYRFRVSWFGDAFYGLLDNFRIFRVLNALRNRSDVLVDNALTVSDKSTSCKTSRIDKLLSVLNNNRNHVVINDIFEAYLRDAEKLSKKAGSEVVFIFRGLIEECPNDVNKMSQVTQKINMRLAHHGISMINLDKLLLSHETIQGDRAEFDKIYGFGSKVGAGHLNTFGHKLVSEVISKELYKWVREAR